MTKLIIPFNYQTYGDKTIILSKQGVVYYNTIQTQTKKCVDSPENIVIELNEREEIQNVNYRLRIDKN